MDERIRKRIRDGLLEAGVRNLKEFGYEGANKTNIVTDKVYSEFFKKMLEDDDSSRPDIVEVRNELLSQIKKD